MLNKMAAIATLPDILPRIWLLSFSSQASQTARGWRIAQRPFVHLVGACLSIGGQKGP